MGIVWVLRRVYRFGLQDIFAALEALLDAGNVVVNRRLWMLVWRF
jgi:predicted nucleic-acid-binding protein